MALRDKYDELIQTAELAGINNLQVREQDNVLYIDGTAPSEGIKKQLWDVYNRIDPNYRSADLIMNISVGPPGGGSYREYEVMRGDTLSKIGKKFGVPWKEIYEANKDLIRDPDLIHPGWKLRIPK